MVTKTILKNPLIFNGLLSGLTGLFFVQINEDVTGVVCEDVTNEVYEDINWCGL
ncbi:hypothetical protein [Methanobacterium ferruginis]|uniref:hypothetical protein n=1 Tax=Methanobacterium ferruginis TaxID=710191 RepID=UPI0025725A4B|nr:hypothetical protein [Methanobacterium ferruginis]BDZ69030.1 hypothetical protein GCM10025860_24780 [Methanobacterium ferruginis]